VAFEAKPAHKATAKSTRREATKAHGAVARPVNFDGSVYGFALTGETLYAATSQGLLRSASSGVTWTVVDAMPLDEWRFVAAAKATVVAASLRAMEISSDGGNTWQAMALPAKVTQISALSVDDRGDVWTADREGLYITADKGVHWQMLQSLVVRDVNSLYFDQAGERILVTANEPSTRAFAIDVRSMEVKSWDTGWNLRLLRPVGNYLVGATLFDGIVLQPRMVDSALVGKQ
jgi:ligand-binding sensor domain-containing protein